MLDITKRLTHTAIWQRRTNSGTPTNNLWGTFTEVSTTTTIACFCFFDVVTQIRQFNAVTNEMKWQLLIPSSLSYISVEDRITNIISNKHVLIYPGGRVDQRLIYDHRSKGIEFLHLILDPN